MEQSKEDLGRHKAKLGFPARIALVMRSFNHKLIVATLERCHEPQDVASGRREKALFDAWLSRWDEAFADFLRREHSPDWTAISYGAAVF